MGPSCSSSGQDWDYLVILRASKMSHGEYVDKPFSLFVHLNGFSPVWILLCSFKCPVIGKISSYFEHLEGFSPVWVWFRGKYVEKLLSCHNFCTWMASLLCGSGSVVSMLRSSCHNFCTWMASLLYGSSHVPSSGQLLRRSCHTGLNSYRKLKSWKELQLRGN